MAVRPSSDSLKLSDLKSNVEYPVGNKVEPGRRLIQVKLTESCLNSIEDLMSSERGAFFSLWFQENGGTIVIPAASGEQRKFQFSMAPLMKGERHGTLECVHQATLNHLHKSQKLMCVGPVEHKLTIKAKEDSYDRTKTLMIKAEEERTKGGAQEIKLPTSRKNKTKSRKAQGIVPFSSRKSPAVAAVSSRPAMQQFQPKSSTLKQKPPANPSRTQKTMRKRVIHILALKPQMRNDIVIRLKKETKRSESAMTNLDSILNEISELTPDGKQKLLPQFYSELEVEEWPYYSSMERELLKRSKVFSTSNGGAPAAAESQSSFKRPIASVGGSKLMETAPKKQKLAPQAQDSGSSSSSALSGNPFTRQKLSAQPLHTYTPAAPPPAPPTSSHAPPTSSHAHHGTNKGGGAALPTSSSSSMQSNATNTTTTTSSVPGTSFVTSSVAIAAAAAAAATASKNNNNTSMSTSSALSSSSSSSYSSSSSSLSAAATNMTSLPSVSFVPSSGGSGTSYSRAAATVPGKPTNTNSCATTSGQLQFAAATSMLNTEQHRHHQNQHHQHLLPSVSFASVSKEMVAARLAEQHEGNSRAFVDGVSSNNNSTTTATAEEKGRVHKKKKKNKRKKNESLPLDGGGVRPDQQQYQQEPLVMMVAGSGNGTGGGKPQGQGGREGEGGREVEGVVEKTEKQRHREDRRREGYKTKDAQHGHVTVPVAKEPEKVRSYKELQQTVVDNKLPSSSMEKPATCTSDASSTSDIPDLTNQFPRISSEQQRSEYKRLFNEDYDEYIKLKDTIEAVSQEWQSLSERMKQLPKHSEEALEIKKQIRKKYLEQNKGYVEQKRRYSELYHRLAHIKRLVVEYDNRHAHS